MCDDAGKPKGKGFRLASDADPRYFLWFLRRTYSSAFPGLSVDVKIEHRCCRIKQNQVAGAIHPRRSCMCVFACEQREFVEREMQNEHCVRGCTQPGVDR